MALDLAWDLATASSAALISASVNLSKVAWHRVGLAAGLSKVRFVDVSRLVRIPDVICYSWKTRWQRPFWQPLLMGSGLFIMTFGSLMVRSEVHGLQLFKIICIN